MSIYSSVTGRTFEQIEAEFDGVGYGAFKQAVADAVAAEIEPIQNRYNDLMKNKDYLESVYKSGAQRASYVAEKTLRKVYKKIGFIQG